MRYLPHTESEVRDMLSRIGVSDVEELFAGIPAKFALRGPTDAPDGPRLNLEPALDEASLMDHLEELAGRNRLAGGRCFLGAGSYDHHIPPAVDQLLLRSEFYTAYTPYQAEYSQGTLQTIFEFQTMVCQLFGMEVANASMYDGASALAEAALMARRVTKRPKILMSEGLHPEYRDTVRAYLSGLGQDCELRQVPLDSAGRTDIDALGENLDERTAGVLVGYPNFLGVIESLELLRARSSEHGAMLITATQDPYALALLRAPGDSGADICVGEGQGLALPPQYGGPGVGLFACRRAAVNKMPGRLVGETVDADGSRGYTLTLSTREQHIRRERATSNICTNHGLVALAMTIRLALLGRRGFREVAELCWQRCEYLKTRINELPGYSVAHDGPSFNEFVVRSKHLTAREVITALNEQGILAGFDLGQFSSERDNELLVAVTERNGRTDIDRLVTALETLG